MGKQEGWQVLGPFPRLTAAKLTRARSWLEWCASGLLLVVFLPLSDWSAHAEDLAGASAENSGGVVLPVAIQGTWQVIQLPLNWRRKFLKEPRPREIAVALLGPTPEEIGADNAPCGPPQSVKLIATDDSGRTRTKVLFNGDYCSSHWHAPANLSWAVGPRIAVESIAVALAPNGNLDVMYRMKRDVGHSDDPSTNTEQHGTWQETLSLQQIQHFIDTF